MPKLFLNSPAKINLFLAVTGRRVDGFHELLSLVLPLVFGDDLEVSPTTDGKDRLHCRDPRVPQGETNLILKAARLFRESVAEAPGFDFRLEKRIPPGGGFGGGSGNAVTALRAMNLILGSPLEHNELEMLAGFLGSDCPLFLHDGPVIVRGRGERVEACPDWASACEGWTILLLDPGFSVSTAWAFRCLAADSNSYTPVDRAEKELEAGMYAFREGNAGPLVRNDLGQILGTKYLIYETLFREIRDLTDVWPGITGSGSGCFFLCRGPEAASSLRPVVDDLLGPGGFLIETDVLNAQFK